MYWFIRKKSYKIITAGLLFSAVIFACNSSNTNTKTSDLEITKHFDIPSFIQKEIDSLQAVNPNVLKTVTMDAKMETKTLKIKDWDKEFSSFKSIDLNKPAYSGSIKVDTLDQVLEYSFTDSNLDLSCVRVNLDKNGNPVMVSIQKQVKNNLYKSSEFLVYEKSKFYIVEKNQDVKIMGNNFYKILGQFKN